MGLTATWLTSVTRREPTLLAGIVLADEVC